MIYDPTVEPLPYGKTSTLPQMNSPSRGWPFSTIFPESGSTPERKEMGALLFNTLPTPTPLEIPLPLMITITPHKCRKLKI